MAQHFANQRSRPTAAAETTPPHHEERILLQRLAHGDAAAFWELWERYRDPLLYPYCFDSNCWSLTCRKRILPLCGFVAGQAVAYRVRSASVHTDGKEVMAEFAMPLRSAAKVVTYTLCRPRSCQRNRQPLSEKRLY